MKMKQIISLLLSVVMVLGMLSGCGNNQSETTDPTPDAAPNQTQENTEPKDTMTFDSTLESIRIVVDGVVHTFDVGVLDGAWYLSAKDAETAFGGNFTEDYVALDAYAKSEDIRYIQDEVLTAAYINTWKSYEVNKWDVEFNIYDDGTDFERAFYMDLVDESLRDRADEQITSTEFRTMLAGLIAKFAPDKIVDFDANVLNADLPLTRSNGIMMAYYAAVCLGVDSYNVGFDVNIAYPDGWNVADDALFTNWNNGPTAYHWDGSEAVEYWACEFDAAHFWALGRRSTVSSTLMFTLNKETGDMDVEGPLTVRDAVSVLMRLYDEAGANYFEELSSEVLTTPSPILSDAHIAKAQANPVVTSEDHPRWTGFVFGEDDASPSGEMGTVEELELSAQLGFNSARIMLHYEKLFSADAQTVNIHNFMVLDKMVATAIENDIHLNILCSAIPGRKAIPATEWTGWVSVGDFDLFINPEKQEQALRIYQILAARYRDIPNFNLSITPFWSAHNRNLSTGLPAPEYGQEDVAAFLGMAIDAIRAEDPDRLIIYEPHEANGYDLIIEQGAITKEVADSKGNVIISYNAYEGAYIYACMTGTEGAHIDNMNRSLDLQPYPNYIYSVLPQISGDNFITMNGCLPAGTTIDLYLENSYGGTLDIRADGVSLYSEKLPQQQHQVGERLSLYYPYAESDKRISVTLESDVDELVISCRNGAADLCGIYLTLPDEYARERWYMAQPIDVAQGLEEETGVARRTSSGIMLAPNDNYDNGRSITIHEDLTYTSENIWAEASAETIEANVKGLSEFDGNCVVRIERATFGGVIWSELAEYYSDLLGCYADYGFSWWSNDWWLITHVNNYIAEETRVEYAGYESFNLELLRLLQQYQSSERP